MALTGGTQLSVMHLICCCRHLVSCPGSCWMLTLGRRTIRSWSETWGWVVVCVRVCCILGQLLKFPSSYCLCVCVLCTRTTAEIPFLLLSVRVCCVLGQLLKFPSSYCLCVCVYCVLGQLLQFPFSYCLCVSCVYCRYSSSWWNSWNCTKPMPKMQSMCTYWLHGSYTV